MLQEFQTENRDAAVSWETAFDMKKHAQPWQKLQQHLNSYTNRNHPKFAKVNLYKVGNKVVMYSLFIPCSAAYPEHLLQVESHIST